MPMKGKAETGFGRRLKELREARGLSQDGLAKLANLAVSGVSKLEQGVAEPHWPTVVSLAEALGCTPSDFLPVKRLPRKRGTGHDSET